MASDNQTVIVGNLVDDPELCFTNNGTPVSNLRVAVTQRVLEDGAWRDGQTSFFRVNAWRETATHLAESLVIESGGAGEACQQGGCVVGMSATRSGEVIGRGWHGQRWVGLLRARSRRSSPWAASSRRVRSSTWRRSCLLRASAVSSRRCRDWVLAGCGPVLVGAGWRC